MADEKRNAKDSEEQVPEDPGCGFVTITLDHATGGVRIGHDNLAPEHLALLANTYSQYAQGVFLEHEREKARQEARAPARKRGRR